MNGGSLEAASLDVAILRSLYAGYWPSAWLTAALVLSFLGSGWMLLGLAPGLATRAWRMPAVAAFATLVSASAAVSLVKMLAGRARPCAALAWCHTLPIDVPVQRRRGRGLRNGAASAQEGRDELDRRLLRSVPGNHGGDDPNGLAGSCFP